MTRPPERPISREPWPAPNVPGLPFAEPPHLDLEACWSHHRDAGGSLAREAHDEAVAAVRVALTLAWQRGDVAGLRPLLAPLALDAPRQSEFRRLPAAEAVAPLDHVVRFATDLVPATGNTAPERLLGPWATSLDARRAPHLFRVATAHGAFFVPDDLPLSAFRRWAGRTPLPSPAERAAARAIAHAPLSAWPIEATGDRWRLGRGAGGLQPDAPVAVPAPAELPGADHAPEQTVVGRWVVTAEGPDVLWGAIVVPGALPAAAEAWVDLLTIEARLLDRRVSTEDVLRKKGHLLAQRVLEAAWLAR